MEDYLTKRFAAVILAKSDGRVLPLTNVGKKLNNRKIDLALMTGDLSETLDPTSMKNSLPTVSAFIELKHIRNRHRYLYANDEDTIGSTFKSLYQQLSNFNDKEFAGYKVKLLSRNNYIYGLVFASYVRREHEDDGKKLFEDRVLREARNHGFRHHDMAYPSLTALYRDVPMKVLKGDYRCTLYVGL
jgi:hypothetical protein